MGIVGAEKHVVACPGCGVSGPRASTQEKAIEAWNSLRRQLEWTKKPTCGGRYWYRSSRCYRPTMWWVYREPDKGLVVDVDDGEYRTLEEFCRYDDEAEWCGPVEAPN